MDEIEIGIAKKYLFRTYREALEFEAREIARDEGGGDHYYRGRVQGMRRCLSLLNLLEEFDAQIKKEAANVEGN